MESKLFGYWAYILVWWPNLFNTHRWTSPLTPAQLWELKTWKWPGKGSLCLTCWMTWQIHKWNFTQQEHTYSNSLCFAGLYQCWHWTKLPWPVRLLKCKVHIWMLTAEWLKRATVKYLLRIIPSHNVRLGIKSQTKVLWDEERLQRQTNIISKITIFWE